MADKPSVKIDPKEVSVDAQGRVVIANKEFSDKLQKMLQSGELHKAPGLADALLDVNFGC
jgi:hypothetical protein